MQNPWDNLKGSPPASSITSKPIESSSLNSLPTPNISQNSSIQSVSASVDNTAFSSSSDNVPAKTDTNRKGAILVLLIGVAFTALDWWLLKTHHEYYVKAAVLGPLAIVGGLAGLISPRIMGNETLDGNDKMLRYAAMAIGLAAGGLNWYLMAN